MIHASDNRLIPLEPHMPGLKLVLDDAEFASVVRREYSIPVESLTATYCRYKPNTSLLVRYDAVVDGSRHSSQPLFVVAYDDRVADDKLATANRYLREHHGAVGNVDVPRRITLFRFPDDPRLKQLRLAHSPERLHSFVDCQPSGYEVLSYKPFRRCVTRIDLDGRPRAVMRCLLPEDYSHAKRSAKSIPEVPCILRPKSISHSDRHSILVMPWIEGTPLVDSRHGGIGDAEVGAALAQLHQHSAPKLPYCTTASQLASLRETIATAARLVPESSQTLERIGAVLANQFGQQVRRCAVLHGDFHAGQVIVGEELTFLDWDRAHNGDPESDVASFLAHERLRQLASQSDGEFLQAREALLDSYTEESELNAKRLAAYLGFELLKVAVTPFRAREAHWSDSMSRLIQLASDSVADLSRTKIPVPALPVQWSSPNRATRSMKKALRQSWLSPALDRANVEREVAPLAMHDEDATVDRIQLLRWKPDRRALILYQLRSSSGTSSCVLAKVTAKRTDMRAADIQARLYERLEPSSPAVERSTDAHGELILNVARPLGVVPKLQLWLQQPLVGTIASDLLVPGGERRVAARIGVALAQLHRLDLATAAEHMHADELEILRKGLAEIAMRLPNLSADILLVLQRCEQILQRFPASRTTGIHRDFYPDQVIVQDDGRIGFVDLDLYRQGDPLIDVGNFVAHLKEAALRKYSDPNALAEHESAFWDAYLTASALADPEFTRQAIGAHVRVSLARHIAISQRIVSRRHTTEPLIRLCLQFIHQQQLPVAGKLPQLTR